ncbi:pheromone-binding protein Gp-9-like [Temnothorax nylanderi]|uniref:pheromone-binding protein Gp-9-like n=1 Tax=Temnothorax nylanderi TaxID=102681 RepID=UPI003A8A4858
MEKLIFYICTFVLISFTIGSKLGSREEHYITCLTENNVSDDDMFTIRDIIEDKHKQENQERIKKNGCVIQCLLQKEGVMEGSEYDVEKMHSEFTKRTNAPSGSKKVETLDNCINETKDLTEKCDKSFALTECFVKAEKREESRPFPIERLG